MSELLDDVTDPGLATLATVLDPVGLATYLPPVLPRHWGALREARVHVLKHHPGQRCTVAIALRTTSGWARFIVALKRLALGRLGSIRALDAVADVFVQTYLGLGRPDVAARLPCYEAAICLQIASNMVRAGHPYWQMKVETMLDEGLRTREQHA